MLESDVCFTTATEMAQRLRRREYSSLELMQAHLAQIERLNPKVNAIVTLTAEQALRDASRADAALQRGDAVGVLHGLPIAYKDLTETAGIRTTFGSPIYKDYVPNQDALVVERFKKAGAITVGKANTPEFGAGSQTFNQVFGETLNPYDLSKTCGGSSGGGAVALACGMIPLSDGSDLGASLRNPASFCNVVGLRPSQGRVPAWPAKLGWMTLGVSGVMGRTVEDVALQMRVVSGPDDRAPTSIREPGSIFAAPLKRDFKGTRIAWSPNFGGLPFETAVTEAVRNARPVLETIGCIAEEAQPDLSDADDIFKVLRAVEFEAKLGGDLDRNRALMKDTVVWNIEEGRKLTGAQVAQAELKRTALYHRMRQFMQKYEFLVLPTMQVAPFDVRKPYIDEINGQKLATYLDWMRSCYYITVTGHPAISVPCGFTADGLPIGLQIVGRHQDDFGVLQLAHAFEQATGHSKRKPSICV